MTTTSSVGWPSATARENGIFIGVQWSKDNTAGCTAEACSFRDSYEVFQEAGAEVIGVSSDSEKSHQQFVKQYYLPFILLSDLGGVVRKFMASLQPLGYYPDV